MKVLLCLLLLTVVACTSPRPTGGGANAVQSGETTAKKASDAARAAETANNTGLILATSNREEPTTQPAPKPHPAKKDTVLEVQFVKGTLTQAGEPIVDFPKVAADAVAADPNVVLSIESSEEVEHAKIVEVTDAAKAAGIKRIKVKVEVEKEVQVPESVPAKKKLPANKEEAPKE